VVQEKIHLMEDELIKSYQKTKREKQNKEILIDKVMCIDDVSWDTYRQIEQLAPFGIENHKPIFLFEGLEITGVKLLVKKKSLGAFF